MLSRRSLLTGSLALIATPATSVLAQQAEWLQNYEAVSRARVQRSTTPVLSPQSLAATEQVIESYRDIAARGGWPALRISANLRVGAKTPEVVALRQRLIATGDLDPTAGESPVYDSYVEAGVRRFQARHGLTATGALNGPTITAMNVPAEVRLRQLELNIVRLRSYSGNLGHRYVVVNIPAALVETVEEGVVQTRHAAGVGKIDRQSPVMNAKITEVNFNPFWTVPASIIRKDLIPKMQKEPNYLSDNKIRIFNGQGQELQPSQVNWFSTEATRYMFRQDPGGDLNSMGFVRINIPNPHGVYMHDTPSKGIFGDDFDPRGRLPHRRPDRPAGQRLLDLHHRLGDPGRPRPVPRRHLQPRRLRQRDPGGKPDPDGAGRGDVPAELRGRSCRSAAKSRRTDLGAPRARVIDASSSERPCSPNI
jgi:L,D-transpeptidase YcbB